jgi:ribosomal protein L11 methyltransferase
LFAHGTDEALLLHALEALDDHVDLSTAEFRTVEDQDWERAWMDQFKPMKFGSRTWIVPWNLDIPAEANDEVIVRLDPGLAFGSGTHPTTALCLQWLDSLDLRNKTVLDYGCGSGILAIAAALLGAGPVAAVDIDPLALEAARYNSERNNVLLDLRPAHQTLPSRYRVTVANILANPLRMLAPLLSTHTEPGGSIALSGILAEQATSVIEAYAPWCDLAVEGEEQGWVLVAGTRR